MERETTCPNTNGAEAAEVVVNKEVDNVSAETPRQIVPALEAAAKPASATKLAKDVQPNGAKATNTAANKKVSLQRVVPVSRAAVSRTPTTRSAMASSRKTTVNRKRDGDYPEDKYIGTIVYKKFPPHGWYWGIVTKVIYDDPRERVLYYRVVFTDDDVDDITLKDLLKNHDLAMSNFHRLQQEQISLLAEKFTVQDQRAKSVYALIDTNEIAKVTSNEEVDNVSAVSPRQIVPASEAVADTTKLSHARINTTKVITDPDEIAKVAVYKEVDNVSAVSPRQIVPALEAVAHATKSTHLGIDMAKAAKVTVNKEVDNVLAVLPRQIVPALEAVADAALPMDQITDVATGESRIKAGDKVSVFVYNEPVTVSHSPFTPPDARLATGDWYSGTVTECNKVVEITIRCEDGVLRYGVAPIEKQANTEGPNTRTDENGSTRSKILSSATVGANICLPSQGNTNQTSGRVVGRALLNDYFVEFDDGDEWWVNEKYDDIRLLDTSRSKESETRVEIESTTHPETAASRTVAKRGTVEKAPFEIAPAPRSTTFTNVTVANKGADADENVLTYGKTAKKTRSKRPRVAKRMMLSRRAVDGMLSTTHVMLAKGATSQITRCVVGQAAKDATDKKGFMQKEWKKENARRKRLANATKVSPVFQPVSENPVVAGNFRGGEFDTSKFEREYVFYRGSKDHTPFVDRCIKIKEGVYKNTRWVDVKDSLKIVDSISGCTMDKEYLVLVPRDMSINRRMMGKDSLMQQQLFEVFKELETRSPPSEIRKNNVKRIMMADGDDSKYIVIGTSPKRFGRGPQQCMKGLDHPDLQLHRQLFGTWYRRVEHCAKKYLPPYLQNLLACVGKICNYENMPLGDDSNSDIWPALAVGRNVFLNVHTDADYFWTLILVIADEPPIMHGPIICYMCFPTLGIAVALCNGDLLMFNPLIPHCVLTRCNGNKEAYCVSMYMKSLLVGGSDNSQVLSEANTETAKFVLDNYTNKKL